jgi:hypothetical protein
MPLYYGNDSFSGCQNCPAYINTLQVGTVNSGTSNSANTSVSSIVTPSVGTITNAPLNLISDNITGITISNTGTASIFNGTSYDKWPTAAPLSNQVLTCTVTGASTNTLSWQPVAAVSGSWVTTGNTSSGSALPLGVMTGTSTVTIYSAQNIAITLGNGTTPSATFDSLG